MKIEKLLKKQDIIEILSINMSTLDRWMAAGDFPAADVRKKAPGAKGRDFVRWKESTLSSFIEGMNKEQNAYH